MKLHERAAAAGGAGLAAGTAFFLVHKLEPESSTNLKLAAAMGGAVAGWYGGSCLFQGLFEEKDKPSAETIACRDMRQTSRVVAAPIGLTVGYLLTRGAFAP